MNWHLRYRLRHHLMTSFWLFPALAIILAIILGTFTRWLDHQLSFSLFEYTADGARTLLGSLSGSLLTFLVFVVSSMLLIVQLASSQLTPRIIAFVFSSRYTQFTLSLFVFSYTFALATQARIDDKVPQLTVAIAVGSTLLSLAVFFWFAQRLGASLRPVSVVQAVGEATRQVMDQVYPYPFVTSEEKTRSHWKKDVEHLGSRVIPYRSSSGVLVAFDITSLVAMAKKADCLIEIIPQVGDFVSKDDPMFRIYPDRPAISEPQLQKAVVIGSERTIELDPMFGFRIMVDIAARALSPAINDPTTAVMSIDQLHRLLRYVGKRQLSDGTASDDQDKLRLAYPTPNWEDFTSMAVTEIRQFGTSSIQIPRRLQAMLEHLLQTMPKDRKPALLEELTLLQQAVQNAYPAGIMRTRAETSDLQGIGGSPGSRIAENESKAAAKP
jgi:uncharacterized membrane protein